MSKQFSILVTDVDLGAIERLLRASGAVDLLSDRPTGGLTDLMPLESLAIPTFQAGKISLFCYMAPRELGRRIVLQRLSPVKTHVNLDHSYLVQFWRPFYDGRTMRRGRLYYVNTVLEGKEILPKNPEFCRWADRVMAKVRKTLKYDKTLDAHVGPHAREGISSGSITVESTINRDTIITHRQVSSER
jgi:hypothetical protein